METEKLELLHDHHKDSFSWIRERERQRDRLFLIAIGLFGGLASAVLFSANLSAVLRTLRIAGSQADLSVLPASAVLSAIWIFTLAITLRYCSVAITVERQYSYLHLLEARISEELGDERIYQREGRAYNDEYPAFTTWAWISYVFIFPVLASITAVALAVIEWTRLPSSWPYKTLDSAVAFALVITLFLYRLWPVIKRRRPVDIVYSQQDDDAES